MPEIKDCIQDIKINKETKDILTAASFGDNHTEIRQQAYDKIETLITEFNGHLFHGDQRTYGGLSKRGSHDVFLVPKTVGKNLKHFRGRLVLVICIGRSDKWPGYSGRKYAALSIDENGNLLKTDIPTKDTKG